MDLLLVEIAVPDFEGLSTVPGLQKLLSDASEASNFGTAPKSKANIFDSGFVDARRRRYRRTHTITAGTQMIPKPVDRQTARMMVRLSEGV